MKKKIYYTVDVEFHDDNYELGPTGNKTINAYDIDTGEGVPKIVPFFDIECDLSDNSVKKMKEWLDDNGYGDEDFEFVQL